jgi:hypothetical protein
LSWRFSRAWRHLERIFPPHGEWNSPEELETSVKLMFDPLSRFFTAGGRLGQQTVSVVGGGGAIDNDFAEPGPGMIHLPVLVLAVNGEATARNVELRLVPTSTALDPWGRWSGTERIIDEGSMPASRAFRFTRPIPVTRGSHLRYRALGTGAGVTVASNYFFVELPGEIISIDDLVGGLR